MKYCLHADKRSSYVTELVEFAMVDAHHIPTLRWWDAHHHDPIALRAADLLIVLAHSASLEGRIIEEAIAAGKPVLLWRLPGAEAKLIPWAFRPEVLDAVRGNLEADSQQRVLVAAAEHFIADHKGGHLVGRGYGHALVAC
jgi:hypothetical protein